MACIYPRSGWKARKANRNGKFPVVFGPDRADLSEPVELRCGRCVDCLAAKARDWSLRCCHEAALHERNCFVTWTYAEPVDGSAEVVRDLQLTMKRLRKAGFVFRYFSCAERGEAGGRWHGHSLIFGEDFLDDAEALSFDGDLGSGYLSATLSDAWGQGHVMVGLLTADSAFYVAGDCLKNADEPEARRIMSRRPGIGRDWLEKYSDDCTKGFVTVDGKKFPTPQAYLRNPEFEESFAELKARRLEVIRSRTPDEVLSLQARAPSREANLKARFNVAKRRAV